jgi:hypothetical protein
MTGQNSLKGREEVTMDNTIRRILDGIACEVGQLDGTIAMLQEARDATERPEVRKEIHAQVLDELSRRNGLYRALRIAADVVEIDAAELGEQDVALIWHQVLENCGRSHREIGLGVMKDNTERVYVYAKACYFTPEIVVTIAVTAPNAGPGEQVGVVEEARRRGSIRHEFANLRAWFYPDAGALTLWEVDLWRGRFSPIDKGSSI